MKVVLKTSEDELIGIEEKGKNHFILAVGECSVILTKDEKKKLSDALRIV